MVSRLSDDEDMMSRPKSSLTEDKEGGVVLGLGVW